MTPKKDQISIMIIMHRDSGDKLIGSVKMDKEFNYCDIHSDFVDPVMVFIDRAKSAILESYNKIN